MFRRRSTRELPTCPECGFKPTAVGELSAHEVGHLRADVAGLRERVARLEAASIRHREDSDENLARTSTISSRLSDSDPAEKLAQVLTGGRRLTESKGGQDGPRHHDLSGRRPADLWSDDLARALVERVLLRPDSEPPLRLEMTLDRFSAKKIPFCHISEEFKTREGYRCRGCVFPASPQRPDCTDVSLSLSAMEMGLAWPPPRSLLLVCVALDRAGRPRHLAHTSNLCVDAYQRAGYLRLQPFLTHAALERLGCLEGDKLSLAFLLLL